MSLGLPESYQSIQKRSVVNTKRSTLLVSSSRFDGNERKYVLDCLDHGWLSQGKYVQLFEEKFAERVGVKYALSCSSGTSALHLIMLALGVDSDTPVIVPSLTYVATANAVKYCGGQVFFSDIDPLTWCIDPTSCLKLYDHLDRSFYKPVVVVPVHIYDSLCQINLLPSALIVEDACHAPGSDFFGDKVGSLGVAAAFSFYGGKVISCGEGGMVVTNDYGIAEKIKLYRGQGATIPGRYHHLVVGYNYRMTDLQAAVGLAQLERLDDNLSCRRGLINRYRSNFASDSRITLQGGERSSGWIMPILIPDPIHRDGTMRSLADQGIETRPFFDPIPSLPPYGSQDLNLICPVAKDVASRGICLPVHTEMTLDDVDRICESLVEVV